MATDSPAVWVLVAGMVCAVIDWVAVIARSRVLEYFFKPAVLVAFVVAAFLLGPSTVDPRFAAWFRVALLFSLAGDVFLMLPGERWFIPGLVAFLVGHLCYIAGFNGVLPPFGAVVPLAVVVLVDALVLPRILASLIGSGETSLRVPVVVYGVILSLTLVSGWTTWFKPGWTAAGRIAASVGGTLFYASDLMLAWDRFVQRSRLLHVLVIITYHLGQLGLVLTMVLH